MMNKCPGQDSRNVRPEVIICPKCSTKVEIFSDEVKVKCPNCKELVCRERLPSCVDWCRYAKECVGDVKWKQIKGGS